MKEPSLGFGSFLTVGFGELRIDSIGRPIREYFLWLDGANWAILVDHLVAATSDDERPMMERAIAELEGATLTSAGFDSDAFLLSLEFGDRVTLQARPADDPEMEHWTLYLPDGTVIVAGPLRELRRESASEPPHG